MKDRLTVIGCRAGSPGRQAAASGYLIETGPTAILVDCGPGVVLELAARRLIDSLDAVIITHRHADHCADLIALAYHRLFPVRQPPLLLLTPSDLGPVLQGLDELFGIVTLPDLLHPMRAAFHWQPVVIGRPFDCARLRVETLRTRHPAATMAIRLPDLGFVYTADGALTADLLHFAAGATVLLAEATYVSAGTHDLDGHGHMTAYQAGRLAQQAQVDRLVLTHLSDLAQAEAALREAAAAFPGSITIARPGLQVELRQRD